LVCNHGREVKSEVLLEVWRNPLVDEIDSSFIVIDNNYGMSVQC